ncbi:MULTISPECIES: hypothetical protein [Paenibacillus]|uniref:hypothetical protein n=1 Tax=Paenibacillus TaxID=44249 RepID=UPI0022B8BAB5|nr:hypothetical protein [Paenibacillus caseinilyticus]MCZ8520569.1 hypothetical protein [Paenibacillus caseinilyticus]
MKLSTFLLGGIVGAAAAVYLSNRKGPMLFSALSSSDAMGSLLSAGQDKKEKDKSKRSESKSASSRSKKEGGAEDLLSASDGMSKVEEIVKKDPQLSATVAEILASSHAKEEHRAH